jgi:hypothetical protein
VGPRDVLDAVVKRKIPSLRWKSNPRIPIVAQLHAPATLPPGPCLSVRSQFSALTHKNVGAIEVGAFLFSLLIRIFHNKRAIPLLLCESAS